METMLKGNIENEDRVIYCLATLIALLLLVVKVPCIKDNFMFLKADPLPFCR